MSLDQCRPHIPPLHWPPAPSPVVTSELWTNLQDHPDQRFASLIMRGLREGFRVGFRRSSTVLRESGHNHPSAQANPSIVTSHITSELSAGRLVGPISLTLVPHIHYSPIGLVPKSHQANKWRLIVDLSSPNSHSTNDGIERQPCSITYSSVDEAVSLIQQLGPGTELVKIDLKSAYRIVPVHPDDHTLLGIRWNNAVYVDRALPFGLRSAPKLFSAVADALAWSLFRNGVRLQLHYLDDFLFFGAPRTTEASDPLTTVLRVFNILGVPIATSKTEGPSTCVTFLGMLLDSRRMELRLPPAKLTRLQALLATWVGRESCRRKELESFLGHLSHAASVVRPGRVFLRLLFSLLARTTQPHYHIRLNTVARADIQWWATFLTGWNGRSLLPHQAPDIHVYTDASGSYGCGAVVTHFGWLQLCWPVSWQPVNITEKELLPIVMATALWGSFWQGKHVCFHCDNMAVVQILRAHTGRGDIVLHLLHCLFFFLARYNIHLSAVHIPGTLNTAADALSRNHMSLFFSIVPQVPNWPIPLSLMELLVTQRPDWGSRDWTAMFLACFGREWQLPHSHPITLANGNI